jgi:hypothetical protein
LRNPSLHGMHGHLHGLCSWADQDRARFAKQCRRYLSGDMSRRIPQTVPSTQLHSKLQSVNSCRIEACCERLRPCVALLFAQAEPAWYVASFGVKMCLPQHLIACNARMQHACHWHAGIWAGSRLLSCHGPSQVVQMGVTLDVIKV